MRPTVLQSRVPEARALYDSIVTPAFKQKCADMFRKADTNGDGSLDASELRAFAVASLPQEAVNDPLFFEAFDTNGDKKIDAKEFQLMMIYFELQSRKRSRKKKDTDTIEGLLPDAIDIVEAYVRPSPPQPPTRGGPRAPRKDGDSA
jgi:hypothetical protein